MAVIFSGDEDFRYGSFLLDHIIKGPERKHRLIFRKSHKGSVLLGDGQTVLGVLVGVVEGLEHGERVRVQQTDRVRILVHAEKQLRRTPQAQIE